MDWLWPAAERAGIPIALFATSFLPALGQIAQRHPKLRLLIDHMAVVPNAKDAAAFAALPELIALAKYPTVAVKASGAPAYSSEPYPYRNIHPYIRQMYDAFGPRMFWGTDITRMPCSYRQCVTMFTEEMLWLKGRDLELVMGRGLADWLGWKLPPAP
jgi:predicted TIM-barrel fold metal-dependent hydrolase